MFKRNFGCNSKLEMRDMVFYGDVVQFLNMSDNTELRRIF